MVLFFFDAIIVLCVVVCGVGLNELEKRKEKNYVQLCQQHYDVGVNLQGGGKGILI